MFKYQFNQTASSSCQHFWSTVVKKYFLMEDYINGCDIRIHRFSLTFSKWCYSCLAGGKPLLICYCISDCVVNISYMHALLGTLPCHYKQALSECRQDRTRLYYLPLDSEYHLFLIKRLLYIFMWYSRFSLQLINKNSWVLTVYWPNSFRSE